MTGTPAPRQLALALDHNESFAREDFLAAPSNAVAIKLIENYPDWPTRAVILAGPEGSGKSHLAAIWAAAAGARFLAARALTRSNLLEALATGALVLEDISADSIDENALFHLLNLVREEEAFLLLTARTPPASWKLAVRDLASRLKALPVVTLAPPDDAMLRAVMLKLFADRQIAADVALVDFLANRIERSYAAAHAAVERLDQEALRLKRPPTRALAAELFRTDG